MAEGLGCPCKNKKGRCRRFGATGRYLAFCWDCCCVVLVHKLGIEVFNLNLDPDPGEDLESRSLCMIPRHDPTVEIGIPHSSVSLPILFIVSEPLRNPQEGFTSSGSKLVPKYSN